MTIQRYVFALFALLAPLGVSAAQTGTPPEAEAVTERNRQFIAQAFADWAAGEGSFFDDVLTEDAVWIIKGSGPSAGVYRGRDDFMERAIKPFADRMATFVQPTVRDIWADGEHVIVHWDGAGTAADGAPYRNSYVWILRMDDGKAAEVIAFLDLPRYEDVLRRVPAPKK